MGANKQKRDKDISRKVHTGILHTDVSPVHSTVFHHPFSGSAIRERAIHNKNTVFCAKSAARFIYSPVGKAAYLHKTKMRYFSAWWNCLLLNTADSHSHLVTMSLAKSWPVYTLAGHSLGLWSDQSCFIWWASVRLSKFRFKQLSVNHVQCSSNSTIIFTYHTWSFTIHQLTEYFLIFPCIRLLQKWIHH